LMRIYHQVRRDPWRWLVELACNTKKKTYAAFHSNSESSIVVFHSALI
jgi:hypothetical protein